MAQSNYEVLGVNCFSLCSENVAQVEERQVHLDFVSSSWYKEIIYVLQKLQGPPKLSKAQTRSIKLKATKFCIMGEYLYWKDPGGVLLKYLLQEEAKEKMQEFHKGDYGGHLYWKTTNHKILRSSFYWPTLFANTYKKVSTCHEGQIF